MSVEKAKKLRGSASATRHYRWGLVLAAWGLAALPGCSQRAASSPSAEPGTARSPAPAEQTSPASASRKPAPRSGATVIGRVVVAGQLPAPAPQPHGSDPYCAKKELTDDSLLVDRQGGVANVMVRIVEAAGGPYAPPAEPVTLTQLDCRYRPRVLGAVLGQPVLVSNSDGTVHNVHALLGDTTLLNQVQVDAQAPLIDLQKALRPKEPAPPGPAAEPLKLRCDIHPWMSAYLFVLPHPFFAVTTDDGTYTLHNVPPGEYTLQAWHERLGALLAKLSISPTAAPATPQRVEFRFTLDATTPVKSSESEKPAALPRHPG